jgi:hypothetical protein
LVENFCRISHEIRFLDLLTSAFITGPANPPPTAKVAELILEVTFKISALIEASFEKLNV